MTGWYSSPPEPEIVWIKNIDQLNDKFPYDSYYKKCVFAKYQVIDITHDNKIVAVKASPKTAEARKARQLAYKKHAKCEVIVRENDIQAKLTLDLSNVFGNDASYEMIRNVEKKQSQEFKWYPSIRDLIIVDRNINMELKITKVDLDKFIITKIGKEMRLTILQVEDRNGNHTAITLFDNDVVDKISENQIIKITNAEVNMRKYADSEESRPEGLKIPSWAKLELISGFSEVAPSQIPEPLPQEIDHSEDPVRCEQTNCPDLIVGEHRNGVNGDLQFFCCKCNMELCPNCVHEHNSATSISGLTCDDQICHGSRLENTLEVVQK